MSASQLANRLESEAGSLPDGLDGDTLDRILTEPQQESLLEALAADAVDAVPLIGDLMVLSRMEAAEEQGIEYPERPSAVENALSDIPAPLDTIGDILIAQNTLQYLDVGDEIAGVQTPSALAEDAALEIDDVVESITPGGDN